MPDTRSHRGPHPEDDELFARDQLPKLRDAVRDLAWLRSRGYGDNAALKLVGDRYQLTRRQRNAVARSACSDEATAQRGENERPVTAVRGQEVHIDGFNVLIALESALGGAYLFGGGDGCYRDIGTLHGTYRLVEETTPAIEHIGGALATLEARRVAWYLDRHVSNTGRLQALLQDQADEHGWTWTVEVTDQPDEQLARVQDGLVVTHDSGILDRAAAWVNLVGFIVDRSISDARVRVLSPARAESDDDAAAR